ncbi:MAG: cyclic nucleotide-binding domain-containing protein, partial [Acidocella sp.]|nr:cyclic nucleotide-binding domain-containing protein [Acidocella sp.]
MSATMMLRSEMRGNPVPMQVARPEIHPVLHYAPDEGIFAEGDAAGGIYRVVSGVVRCCKFLADGRRHIDAFHKAGDVFGFELGGQRQFCIEAVTACALVKLRRSFPESDSAAAAQLYAYAMRSLAHAQAHSQLLGRATAGQRLAHFLLDMGGA